MLSIAFTELISVGRESAVRCILMYNELDSSIVTMKNLFIFQVDGISAGWLHGRILKGGVRVTETVVIIDQNHQVKQATKVLGIRIQDRCVTSVGEKEVVELYLDGQYSGILSEVSIGDYVANYSDNLDQVSSAVQEYRNKREEVDRVKFMAQWGITEENTTKKKNSVSSTKLTREERDYQNEVKYLLDDGNIGPKERMYLERVRIHLGINEKRAKEIESL